MLLYKLGCPYDGSEILVLEFVYILTLIKWPAEMTRPACSHNSKCLQELSLYYYYIIEGVLSNIRMACAFFAIFVVVSFLRKY